MRERERSYSASRSTNAATLVAKTIRRRRAVNFSWLFVLVVVVKFFVSDERHSCRVCQQLGDCLLDVVWVQRKCKRVFVRKKSEEKSCAKRRFWRMRAAFFFVVFFTWLCLGAYRETTT